MTERDRSLDQQGEHVTTQPISFIQEMYHPLEHREEATIFELSAQGENPARIASENLGESNIFSSSNTKPELRGGEAHEQIS